MQIRVKGNSMKTSSYGPRGDGAEIAYAIVDSALGRLLVAGTEHGSASPRWAKQIGRWSPSLSATIRARRFGSQTRIAAPTRASAFGPMRSPNTSPAARRFQRRRWIFAARPFSLQYGTSSARFLQARRARTPKSRDALDAPRNPRRRHRQRRQSSIDYHPMSSRDPRVGPSRRLSMGPGAQANVTGDGIAVSRGT